MVPPGKIVKIAQTGARLRGLRLRGRTIIASLLFKWNNLHSAALPRDS
jgi:hypothetical protein